MRLAVGDVLGDVTLWQYDVDAPSAPPIFNDDEELPPNKEAWRLVQTLRCDASYSRWIGNFVLMECVICQLLSDVICLPIRSIISLFALANNRRNDRLRWKAY